jgi:hypothetical protein
METTLGICHIGTVSTEEIAVEFFWLYVKFKESESQSSYQSRPFESMHGLNLSAFNADPSGSRSDHV